MNTLILFTALILSLLGTIGMLNTYIQRKNSYTPVILFIVAIGFWCLLYEKTHKTEYLAKVYYEYDIYNTDTIPVDTIIVSEIH